VSAALSTAAIVIGLFVLLSIRRSGGQLAGKYRVIVGIAFNVVSLPVTLVMIWARALVNSTV
jgi:hypothetical protein